MEPGSLNYLLRRPRPLAATKSPPSTPSSSSSPPAERQEGTLSSLNSDRARSVFKKRVIVALAFSLIVNFVILYCLAFTFHFHRIRLFSFYTFPLFPLEFIFTVGKPYTFSSSVVVTALVGSFAYQSSWTRPNTGTPTARGQIFTRFRVMLPLLVYPILAGVLARCYYGMTGTQYSAPIQECAKSGPCLVERNLFVTFCTAFCGLFFTLHFRIYHEYIIKFSCVGKSFKEKFLMMIKTSVRESAVGVVVPMVFFYCIYYIQGDYLLESAAEYYQAHLDPDYDPIARFANIFSGGLFVWSFYISVLSMAVMRIANRSFQICVTQRLDFPIEYEIHEEPGCKMLLAEALGSTSYYLKYLACYDLKLISENLESRLVDIFKLSHPGGNPINWMSLFNPCVSIIEGVRKAVDSIIETERKSRVVKRVNDEYFSDPRNPNCKVLYSSLAPISFHGDPFLYRRVDGQEIRSLANRDMEPQGEFQRNGGVHPILNFIATPTESLKILYTRMVDHLIAKVTSAFSFRRFSSFWKPKSTTMTLIVTQLAHSTLLLWSCQILTNIACCSLVHDVNGAVQYSLGKLIGAQVQFYQTLLDVERLRKEFGIGSSSVSVNRQGNQDTYEQKLLGRLLKTYRHSLCRLYHHFSPYMKLIQIEEDLIQKWKNAVNRPQDENKTDFEKENYEAYGDHY